MFGLVTKEPTPEELQQLQQYYAKLGFAAKFPWHEQQQYALRAATDIIVVLGGNRSGKSQSGVGIVSRVVNREGPIYRRLRNPQRKLKIWVAPQTLEKYRSVWESYIARQIFAGWEPNKQFIYRKSPDPVFTWFDDYGGGEIWGKSQDQGFMSFESDDVDLVLFDEEPEDRQLYSSARTRLATTNGVIALTYTPLKGMTWTYDEVVQPVMKDEYKIADRVWRDGNSVTLIQMGMADNPESVKGGGVARAQGDKSMSPAEKAARLYGTYGYTEGLLIPEFATLRANEESCPYVIDRLPDVPLYWLLTVDPNKRNGGLLSAWDSDGNRYYCAEHYRDSIPDSEHARCYRKMLKQFKLQDDDVFIAADPGGAGSQAIINLAEHGLYASPVPKDAGSVAASIKRLRNAAWIDPKHRHPLTKKFGAPKVYFLRSLESEWKSGGVNHRESRLMYEFRMYRQKPEAPPDTPVKQHDDVVDCARYAELVRMHEPELVVVDEIKQQRAKLDDLSRKAAEEWDDLVKQVEKKGGRVVKVQ